jgi:hypothetical protein
MKWLLVTTNPAPNLPNTAHQGGGGWNIGDVFARIGVEQVIREVDPSAEFDLLNMDSTADVMREREFDRCVLAGRPLFWKDCEKYPEWTHILGGWPGRDRRKIAALGVGDCYALPRDDAHLRARLSDLKAKTFSASVRFAFDTDDVQLGVCPASWVLLDRPEKPTRKLCNLMPNGGGHYADMAPLEANLWGALLPSVAKVLIEHDFEFIAHTVTEYELAREHGWPYERVTLADNPEPYLATYASASHYFGNRMHGATILACRNANALAVGYDSRLKMVSRVWLDACQPSELSLRAVADFAASETWQYERRTEMIRGERKRAVEWMREFAT